jgi:hypothetical protein
MNRAQIANLLPWFAAEGDKFLPPQPQIKDLLLARDPYQIYDYGTSGVVVPSLNGNNDDRGLLIQRFNPFKLPWIDLVNLCRPHLPPDEFIPRRNVTRSQRTVVEQKGVQWQITKIWDNGPVTPEITYEPYIGPSPNIYLNSSLFANFPLDSGYARYVYDNGVQQFYSPYDTSWQTVYPSKRFVYYYYVRVETDAYELISDTTQNFTGVYDANFNSWSIRELLLNAYSDSNFFFSEQTQDRVSWVSAFTPSTSSTLVLLYYVAVAGLENWEQVYLDKHHQVIKLTAGKPVEIKLPYGIVAHSLSVTGANSQQFSNNLIKNPAFSPNITVANLFPPISPDTIAALNQSRVNVLPPTPPLPSSGVQDSFGYRFIAGRVFYVPTRTSIYWSEVSEELLPSFRRFMQRIYYGNNNIWGETNVNSFLDLNYDQTLYLGDATVIDRFFTWSSNPSDLNYSMPTSPYFLDSLKKIEAISRALDAEKYSVNETDPLAPRVANLGFLLERTAAVLGIRRKPDGTIDVEAEKTAYRRTHADGGASNDEQEYNFGGFGSKGMLLRHLPNKFRNGQIVEGGYRKVHDLPQMLAELHEQVNSAVGIQEGTAIEINVDGKTYRYPNQLALTIEIFTMLQQTHSYSKKSFFSTVVSEQSIKEVISGLGLRTVDKNLTFTIAGKEVKLYYKGISASQSLRRKISAVATNVGTVLGNLI